MSLSVRQQAEARTRRNRLRHETCDDAPRKGVWDRGRDPLPSPEPQLLAKVLEDQPSISGAAKGAQRLLPRLLAEWPVRVLWLKVANHAHAALWFRDMEEEAAGSLGVSDRDSAHLPRVDALLPKRERRRVSTNQLRQHPPYERPPIAHQRVRLVRYLYVVVVVVRLAHQVRPSHGLRGDLGLSSSCGRTTLRSSGGLRATLGSRRTAQHVAGTRESFRPSSGPRQGPPCWPSEEREVGGYPSAPRASSPVRRRA